MNAYTTLTSLKAGVTNCDFSEDRSGYWVASVYKNGVKINPTHVSGYYSARGLNISGVQAYPEGLRLIAGDSKATTPQSISIVTWSCSNAFGATVGQPGASVPTCSSGQQLQLGVRFPECWDGKNLDSVDHKSHVKYIGSGKSSCPSSHPKLVPSLNLIAQFPTTGGAGTTLASGGQYSGHADFFNAWDPSTIADLVVDCIIGLQDCHAP